MRIFTAALKWATRKRVGDGEPVSNEEAVDAQPTADARVSVVFDAKSRAFFSIVIPE